MLGSELPSEAFCHKLVPVYLRSPLQNDPVTSFRLLTSPVAKEAVVSQGGRLFLTSVPLPIPWIRLWVGTFRRQNSDMPTIDLVGVSLTDERVRSLFLARYCLSYPGSRSRFRAWVPHRSLPGDVNPPFENHMLKPSFAEIGRTQTASVGRFRQILLHASKRVLCLKEEKIYGLWDPSGRADDALG